MNGSGQIWGRALGIEAIVVALTLVVVGGLLTRQAFTGKYLRNGWLVSRNEQNAGEPRWYHRASTFGFGLGLFVLGIWVTLRAFLS